MQAPPITLPAPKDDPNPKRVHDFFIKLTLNRMWLQLLQ